MRHVNLIMAWLVAVAGEVDKLKDEGSASYDAAAAREEVSADDVL
jgi:hypothetical protein